MAVNERTKRTYVCAEAIPASYDHRSRDDRVSREITDIYIYIYMLHE